MSQSLARIYIHLIYSTKARLPLVHNSVRDELHAYTASILKAHQSPAIAIGSTQDHLHILFVLSKNCALCKIVEQVKKSSSKWLKTKRDVSASFGWQNGYGAFSVSKEGIESVKRYIENQLEHHRHKTFQEEFREFLERYQVEYDERYVWN